MRNFTVQSLITLLVTSLALLLTPMKSDAQVNMNLLSQVAESCQEDAFSPDYYKKMNFSMANIQSSDYKISFCINYRYHYLLVLSKFPWLASSGKLVDGYPASVAAASLAFYNGYNSMMDSSITDIKLLDCLASQDASSKECDETMFKPIARNSAINYCQDIDFRYFDGDCYLVYVCPSCVISHNEILSREMILNAFIKWFLSLDNKERREIISVLRDENESKQLSREIFEEAERALSKYEEVKERVEQQEQERRRQELLGN